MPITEVKKIWMNGRLVDWKDAKVHVLTHAMHYGTGVFEGIRCYETPKGHAVFRLSEHIARLFEGSAFYRMKVPYSQKEICGATKDVVRANGLKSGYIRPIVYRGYGEMGLNPLKSPVDVAIAVWPWGTYLGDDGLKNGIKVAISSYQRISPKTMPPQVKATGNYINSILAKLEAIDKGADEAILLDCQGNVSEGPGENVFAVKGKKIYTPSLDSSILKGITRQSVMEIAKDLGHEVMEVKMKPADLLNADEAFFTGTAAEITPIREIDGKVIGKPGRITKDIQGIFFDAVHGKNERYVKWLDFVD